MVLFSCCSTDSAEEDAFGKPREAPIDSKDVNKREEKSADESSSEDNPMDLTHVTEDSEEHAEGPNSSSSPEEQVVDILGPFLKNYDSKDKISTVTALKDKERILLYFGAQWQRGCRKFTPQLAKFFEACDNASNMQVVYISADRNQFEYRDAHAHMPTPWLAMPAGTASYKNRLSSQLEIGQLPFVAVLDHDGCQIRTNAVEEILKLQDVDKEDYASEAKKLVHEWKACSDRTPLDVSRQEDMSQSTAVRQGLYYWEGN